MTDNKSHFNMNMQVKRDNLFHERSFYIDDNTLKYFKANGIYS